MNNHFASAHRVKFDLYKKFGLIAAAGDRHLAEFLPNFWYLKSPERVKEWKFGLTNVQWRIDKRQELLQKGKSLAEGKEDFVLRSTGEEGVDMIKALLGLGDLVTNVNLPNNGQIQGLPENAVVETNALFRNDSIQPVCAGKLPIPIQNMVSRHIHNQETILQAALKKDKELAFQAFVQDPLVHINPEDAKELFDKMLLNTNKYLIGWKLQETISSK
jgi:galacturan 1,4-alpha-galacturonidase